MFAGTEKIIDLPIYQGTASRLNISELVDIPRLKKLLQRYSDSTGMVTALLNLEGDVLIATNWQSACTNFHRKNKDTCANCKKSDTSIASALEQGQTYNVYKCKNGLVDVATPIKIQGQHVANLFTGQFFLEPPNLDIYREKAKKFKFDEKSYLAAIQRVPVYNENQIEKHFYFLVELAEMIAEMGMTNLKLFKQKNKIQQEIMQFESSLEKFVSIAPVGIAKNLASTGSFISVNEEFTRFTGYTKDELNKLSYWDLTPREFENLESKQLKNLEITGRYGPYEKEYIHKSGYRFPVMLHGVLIREENGLDVIWSIVQDISISKEREQLLRDAQKMAEASNNAKSSFLANMSHEIKTPLNAIMGYSEALLTTFPNSLADDRGRQYTSNVLDSAVYLSKLIHDLLDLSKIEAGKLDLKLEEIDLAVLIHDCIEMIAPLYEEKNQIVNIIEMKTPIIVFSDKKSCQQIIVNLLSNAGKYSGNNGSIKIRCDITNDNSVSLEIEDNGIGMTPNECKNAITPFSNLHDPEIAKKDSHGLGLSIVKKLSDANGLTFKLKSQKGKGTTATVIFPSKSLSINDY